MNVQTQRYPYPAAFTVSLSTDLLSLNKNEYKINLKVAENVLPVFNTFERFHSK